MQKWTHSHSLLLLALLILGVWLFYHEYHNKGFDLATMQKLLDSKQQDIDKLTAANKTSNDVLEKQLTDIAQQKQQVITVPSAAPQIIHETIPLSQPIIQTAPITKDTLPDAPVAQLTLKQEQDLATFGLQCKACNDKLAALQTQDANKDSQIKDLTAQRDKAVETAKGGSVFKRTLKVVGVVACAGGSGWLGSKANGNSKGAAVGAAVEATACALKFHF